MPSTPTIHSERPVLDHVLDHVVCASAEDMAEVPDESVHLVVTSPPYNVGKEYDEERTLPEYRAFLCRVWQEVLRVLVPGGRLCVNVANVGRRPYVPLHAYLALDLLDLGFLMRGEIIWNKGASVGISTAWGSWRSPSNPTLRDVHEYVVVFSKGGFARTPPSLRRPTISTPEFLTCTRSVWTMPTVSATRIGHPAPFPVELPYRLIQLYTYEGDVALDPFMGSGQTAIAARRAGRHFVGYEIQPAYVDLARRRIEAFAEATPAPSPVGPRESSPAPETSLATCPPPATSGRSTRPTSSSSPVTGSCSARCTATGT